MWPFKKKKIIIVDSTEKCAGTTIKDLLRKNFSEKHFFDYDNGDPPSEKIRNYGIKCNIFFEPPKDDDVFEEHFIKYLDKRGMWLSKNHHLYNLKCVYGNGLFIGNKTILEHLQSSKKQTSLNKFLRNPLERIASEYYYVLQHGGHNLHKLAVACGSLENYILTDARPKNRMCQSILGSKAQLSGKLALQYLANYYEFVGFVENFSDSIKKFCDLHSLKNKKTTVKNANKNKSSVKPSSIRLLIEKTDAEDTLLYKLARERF